MLRDGKEGIKSRMIDSGPLMGFSGSLASWIPPATAEIPRYPAGHALNHGAELWT
jgi:hypothetical protein